MQQGGSGTISRLVQLAVNLMGWCRGWAIKANGVIRFGLGTLGSSGSKSGSKTS